MTYPLIKQHPVYDDYWLSTDGYVYSNKNNGWGKSDTLKEMKRCKDTIGYYQVTLYKNNKNSRHLIHRLIAETFIPNPDDLPVINHIDRNIKNNSVSNLEWCTQQHNVEHGKSCSNLYLIERESDGHILETLNLRRWCREYNIDRDSLRNNYRNQYKSYHKGYKIVEVLHV